MTSYFKQKCSDDWFRQSIFAFVENKLRQIRVKRRF